MSRLFRYLAQEIFWATLLLLVALLALFALFDFIREMGDLGKGQYRFATLCLYVLLTQPAHLVVVFPMAALMGTLFAIARLSAQSELTVMRASGLSLMRLGALCALIGLVFSAIVLAFGEFVAPSAEEWAKRTKLNATTNVIAKQFRSGFWMKDDLSFVNIGTVTPEKTLQDVRIYEFDGQYKLTALSVAKSGAYDVPAARWALKDVSRTAFVGEGARIEHLPTALWNSAITPDLISVLLVRPDSMPIASLYSFIDHLRGNRSNSTQYELAFWSKVFQPVTTVIMMLLAIPFAIQQQRSRGVGAMMLAGILAGLSVYFLNQLAGNLTVINDWPPLLSVSFPHLAFLGVALALIALKERPIRWRGRERRVREA
ncbi:MAG: LPS export ABC transporter permease LptG [Betaproteobacteria bacterium]|nr:LPS export ABC transporter permease LptG [Betaproteobacteria bacterium]